jgi:hypothetical protein
MAVTVNQFLGATESPASAQDLGQRSPVSREPDLSVGPTEIDSHISTSTYAPKALVPNDLQTLVHKQLETSELETVSNQLMTSIAEQPNESIRHGQCQGSKFDKSQERISKR